MREKTSQLTGHMERLPAAATASDGTSSGNSVFLRAATFSRPDGSYGDIVVSGDAVLPVLPALAELLPAGGLARGSVVAVDRSGLLCLALVAGA
jgi:hypothetical protein